MYDYLLYLINKVFYVENQRQLNVELYPIWQNALNKTITEQEMIDQFINIIRKYPHNKNYVITQNHKIDLITKNITFQPKKILDIGAGFGGIANAVKKYYELEKKDAYVLELQPIVREDVTILNYDENGNIPLPDNSIDIIIMMSLLHHVEPDDRLKLLQEVKRIITPNGVIIIREHDIDNNDYKKRLFIQLLHYVWYIANNEHYDPLCLMTRDQLLDIMKTFNFESYKYLPLTNCRNVQQIYGELFKQSKSL